MTKDGDFELIFETCDGDKVLRDESNVLVRFAQKRNGIVTSWINAGYREDLEAVFNHQLSQDTLDEEESEEIEISDYLKGLSHEMASAYQLRDLENLKSQLFPLQALMSMQVLQAILQVITRKTAILIWISIKVLVIVVKVLMMR